MTVTAIWCSARKRRRRLRGRPRMVQLMLVAAASVSPFPVTAAAATTTTTTTTTTAAAAFGVVSSPIRSSRNSHGTPPPPPPSVYCYSGKKDEFAGCSFAARRFAPSSSSFVRSLSSSASAEAEMATTSTEMDSPLFFANVVEAEQEEEEPPSVVQRYYQTLEWKHPTNNKTYKINYRVEDPPTATATTTTVTTTTEAVTTATPPPVLLVHGFGGNVNHYRHQYPALTKAGYRVFAIDLIGFGASEKATDIDYSIELFVQLLSDFLHAMNQRYYACDADWMVAGNSIGGLCCLGLAKQLPELVQGVILFNCAGGMSGFRYEDVPFYVRPILYLFQTLVLKEGAALLGKQFFENFKRPDNIQNILLTQGVYRQTHKVNDELLELLLRPADDPGAETVFLKVFGGPPGPTPQAFLSAVPCPILALWGDSDPWTPYNQGPHPATNLPQYHMGRDFQLVVLDNTGHCPHDENPDQVHSHMLPWMKQVAQRYRPSLRAATNNE